MEFSLKLPDNNMVTLESTSVLEHIVLPSDTLQGDGGGCAALVDNIVT